ncbi:Sucrose nonfermenting 4-like protein [Porphyridium purpureum]|uniref:Sucrose nonfermenting 4-like protein n=1 Tax=Porphyridium purpureum TaxID=35688 RepID=A0A5J4Z6G3_PORPP|nr:Sucrose nonfermenting 4-like protein [Porphyridium purpureum]|eukprot:POR3128..scf295_1
MSQSPRESTDARLLAERVGRRALNATLKPRLHRPSVAPPRPRADAALCLGDWVQAVRRAPHQPWVSDRECEPDPEHVPDCADGSLCVRFVWHGGAKVELLGSFTQWATVLALAPRAESQQANEETLHEIVLDLPVGKHQYMYRVDGAWRCDASRCLERLSRSGEELLVNVVWVE